MTQMTARSDGASGGMITGNTADQYASFMAGQTTRQRASGPPMTVPAQRIDHYRIILVNRYGTDLYVGLRGALWLAGPPGYSPIDAFEQHRPLCWHQ